MDRNREARRGTMAVTNGALSRRRHRSNSLRDSPEEDGQIELQEPARLRDRGVKKDRDRDRDRERDRDRDRLNRNKRRRGDRLIHGGNREDGGEDSTEESVNDEEEEDDDDGVGGGGGGAVRMLPPNPAAAAAAMSNHHHNHQQRKSFPPAAAKVFRPAAPSWKAADEMIGVSVPRKARSASTKRAHECWIPGGVGGEQIHRQASTSPVRPNQPSPSPAPVSPSSSNASVRKKMKPNGSKPRPPKSSSKSSSHPEELEIEIAEVLYGLKTHSQTPSKKEIMANDLEKFDSRDANKSSSHGKSRVSSPISNSPSTAPQATSSSTAPLSAVAPKRKRPRQVSDNMGSYSVRSSPISSATKVEIDQPPKTEISSPNLEKISGSVAENGGVAYDLGISMAVPPLSEPPTETTTKPENSESRPLTEEAGESRDVAVAKEEVTSPKKGSPAVRAEDDREDVTATKANSAISEIENNREEKFLIDLMAPPPQLRSSPEREGAINFSVTAADHKSMVSDVEMRPSVKDKEEDKAMKISKEDGVNKEAMEPEEKKVKLMVEEAESQKPVVVISKERIIDLQLDLDKPERDSGIGSTGGHRLNHHVPKQQQQLKATKEEPHPEKAAQATSLPLPMSVASWPSGLSPMGYMAPLQGVVSMDGSSMSSAPLQPFLSQPRPKRCATHCYIARNIQCLQQFMKMNSLNSFWPAAAGSASLFGAKPGSLTVVPNAELHGSIAGRSVNSIQDKGQTLAVFPGHTGKDKSSQAASIADAAQRKQQILLQQAMPQGVPPSNILHGPAFIFPLSQQQQAAVAAASVRPAAAKSPTITGGVATANASGSASVSASATAATAVSFNYPNIPANETQYLAILQNNAYPFPIPAVGGPPNYRGTHHAQAMPYFNGSFYSSQMIHPSQLQHQQQQPSAQPQQMQTGHQNTSLSSGSSSSQKHLQNQQQRPQGSSANGGGGSGNLNTFPAPKNRSSQPPQQQSIQHIPQTHQARQLENEVGGEDSPSTADSSRVSRAMMGVYGQNFAMPIHPQNFALMTPPVLASSSSNANGGGGGGNQSEKKQHQQSQQLGMKAGVETLPPQTFAMSFASMNGNSTPPSIDISSMAHNHAILQSLSEATRQNFQLMAAAPAAQAAQQQKKNFRASEEAKSGGGDSASADEEKKGLAGKVQTPFGQSIAFSRLDLADQSVSSISGNNVIDSSARNLNLVSGPARTSRAAMANPSGTVNGPSSQLQAQMQHHQQNHMIQLQKHQQQQHQQQQQQMAAATARSKTPATSNGSAYSEHLTSSPSMAAKYPNSISGFPQNLVQSNSSNSPTQSPQWKNSVRTTTSQVPSSLASSTPSSSLKNLPQQQARTQQNHTQISFGASPKSSAANTNQSPSPPMVVGSPNTSSISKGASGSPRTTSASTGNKATQPSSLSSQQTKNSPSVPSRKSSPVGGRNVPSIISNPTSTGTKPQIQQQQLPKHNLQQPHLFFSNAYMSAQASHSTNTSSTAPAAGGYYLQRRRADQSQQTHQPPGSSTSSSTGMLSLCPPVTLGTTTTSDPAKAIAAASNMKGGGYPAQFVAQPSGNTHQLLPAGFPYVHAVPAAVQVKPAEQKQPAGNDNLHACWQPEKK